jgi:hypothetical protein
VDVRVDERGREHEPRRVDDSMAVAVQAGADLGDHAGVDPDVHDRVDPFDRIEHARAGHEQILLRRVAVDQHHATSCISAARTATGPCVSRS